MCVCVFKYQSHYFNQSWNHHDLGLVVQKKIFFLLFKPTESEFSVTFSQQHPNWKTFLAFACFVIKLSTILTFSYIGFISYWHFSFVISFSSEFFILWNFRARVRGWYLLICVNLECLSLSWEWEFVWMLNYLWFSKF